MREPWLFPLCGRLGNDKTYCIMFYGEKKILFESIANGNTLLRSHIARSVQQLLVCTENSWLQLLTSPCKNRWELPDLLVRYFCKYYSVSFKMQLFKSYKVVYFLQNHIIQFSFVFCPFGWPRTREMLAPMPHRIILNNEEKEELYS